MEVTEALKLQVWNKGIIVPEYPSSQVRKDASGAYIVYEHYGNVNSKYGWQIDHIYPESILQSLGVEQSKIDNIVNLRPLNQANNRSKSDNYPSYTTILQAEGNENVERAENKIVNQEVQDALKLFFNL